MLTLTSCLGNKGSSGTEDSIVGIMLVVVRLDLKSSKEDGKGRRKRSELYEFIDLKSVMLLLATKTTTTTLGNTRENYYHKRKSVCNRDSFYTKLSVRDQHRSYSFGIFCLRN